MRNETEIVRHNLLRRFKRAEDLGFRCRLKLAAMGVSLPVRPAVVIEREARSPWLRAADLMVGVTAGLALATAVVVVHGCEREQVRQVKEDRAGDAVRLTRELGVYGKMYGNRLIDASGRDGR